MSDPMHQRRKNGRNNDNNNNGSMYRNNNYNPSSLESGRMSDTNANILEQQNNDRISELSEQVARLKGMFWRARL
jgi:blocked-early-in-transport protein 1